MKELLPGILATTPKQLKEQLDRVKWAPKIHIDIMDGKFGPYFRCMNCGNISLKKALEMNPGIKDNDSGNNIKDSKPKERKEITITSDQVDVYYSSED